MKNYKAIIITILAVLFGNAVANAEIVVSDGFGYQLNDDNTASVYSYNNDYLNSNIIIPETVTYEGTTYTVTGIRNNLFENKTVHKIVIPSTIETFGAKVFYNASIDSLIIADGNTTIKVEGEYRYDKGTSIYTWTYSFGGYNNKYKYIYLGRKTNMNESHSGRADDYYYSYDVKSKADTLEIGPLLTYIEDLGVEVQVLNIPYSENSLSIHDGISVATELNIDRPDCSLSDDGLKTITTVNIGKNITVMGKYFLRSLTNVKTLRIPNNVVSIDPYALNNFRQLQNLELEDGNTSYVFENNTLYNASKTEFVYCMSINLDDVKRITLPASVTSIAANAFLKTTIECIEARSLVNIGDYAFSESNLSEIITDGHVQTIGDGAFSYSKNQVVVDEKFFDNVTSIGNSAFYSCLFKNQNITINNLSSLGSWAFSASNINTISISGSLKAIGKWAFNNCSELETAIFPNGIQTVSEGAFKNATALKHIELGNELKSIGSSAFNNCVGLSSLNLPEGIESIGVEVFYNCENLVLDDNVFSSLNTIGKRAFYGCKLLNNNIKFNNICLLGSEAFVGTAIKSVEVNGSLSSIPDNLFNGSTQLESFTLGDKSVLTTIGDGAFAECVNLTVNDGVFTNLMNIGAEAFKNCRLINNNISFNDIAEIGKSAFENTSIKSLSLSGSITAIEQNCFNHCVELESVSISAPVRSVESCAFNDCRKLGEIDLGEQISTIGDGAFEGCYLRTVKLGSALRSVGDAAFNKNYNLKNVYCNSTVAPSAFDNSFLEGYDATLHVPQGARQRYMIAPGWRYFANIIQDESLSGADEVSVDGESMPVEYYDMQGRRVENPTNGVYIKRQGSKVEKVIK